MAVTKYNKPEHFDVSQVPTAAESAIGSTFEIEASSRETEDQPKSALVAEEPSDILELTHSFAHEDSGANRNDPDVAHLHEGDEVSNEPEVIQHEAKASPHKTDAPLPIGEPLNSVHDAVRRDAGSGELNDALQESPEDGGLNQLITGDEEPSAPMMETQERPAELESERYEHLADDVQANLEQNDDVPLEAHAQAELNVPDSAEEATNNADAQHIDKLVELEAAKLDFLENMEVTEQPVVGDVNCADWATMASSVPEIEREEPTEEIQHSHGEYLEEEEVEQSQASCDRINAFDDESYRMLHLEPLNHVPQDESLQATEQNIHHNDASVPEDKTVDLDDRDASLQNAAETVQSDSGEQAEMTMHDQSPERSRDIPATREEESVLESVRSNEPNKDNERSATDAKPAVGKEQSNAPDEEQVLPQVEDDDTKEFFAIDVDSAFQKSRSEITDNQEEVMDIFANGPEVTITEETTTIPVQFNDDEGMLRDFLSRTNASKAARIAKRSSLSHKRDSDVIKMALASPRRALETLDTNSPSPRKTQEAEALSRNMSSPTENTLTLQDITGDVDELSRADPTPCRSGRGIRPKKDEDHSAANIPQTISIRRPEVAERITVKKSEAQEMAILTRTNTRRNKGGSTAVKHKLKTLKDQEPEEMAEREIPEGAKTVTWSTDLVTAYFDAEGAKPEEGDAAGATTSRPRARRAKALGTMNGTPAKPGMSLDASTNALSNVNADKENGPVVAEQNDETGPKRESKVTGLSTPAKSQAQRVENSATAEKENQVNPQQAAPEKPPKGSSIPRRKSMVPRSSARLRKEA